MREGSRARPKAGRGRIAGAVLLLLLAVPAALAGEFDGTFGVLPQGSELDAEQLWVPREVFRSEAIHGRKSYLVNLGDMAFDAPEILGGAARQAGISCNTCHVNGTSNPALFVTGLSTRPGNFDTTSPLFHAKADNGVLDPVTVPSLRGARVLAPYGHDGRFPSLRDFVRNVIVGEFSGPEPSPELLDALVAYIQDIDFLPNRRLGLNGKLVGPTSEAERRGEALFRKPFTHDPELSCAACHDPSAGFTDHRQHDVGSGGIFKTPTLLNANFNAPYFHDGVYRSYGEVVVHFDRLFYLGLTARDRSDLVAYLAAIGDGETPYVRDGVTPRLKEITDFVSVLDTAIPEGNAAIVALTIDTVGRELRELAEAFPERKNPVVTSGRVERAKARAAIKELALALRAVDRAVAAGHLDEAATALSTYRTALDTVRPTLAAAEPFSFFDPVNHDAQRAALRALRGAAIDPVLAAQRHLDND